jgi:para-aminobenzoate synthetase component 1
MIPPTSVLDAQPIACDRAPALVEELRPAPEAWSAFQACADLPRAIFLDSALVHSELGRYSFIAADPYEWLLYQDGKTALASRAGTTVLADPFTAIAQRLSQHATEPLPGLPPFQGGAAGLFGYDLCHVVERLPRPRFDEFQLPDLAIGLYDWVIAFDHAADRAWIISTGFPEMQAARRRARAARRMGAVARRLARGALRHERAGQARLTLEAPTYEVPRLPGLLSSFDRDGYVGAVRRAIDYIHAGDCFQVNVAQRLLFPTASAPLDVYARLRERNPATFSGYFDLGEFAIASASPERFVRCAEAEVETRPIKGTRPRGQSADADRAQAAALLASAKDRAENIMIVDLLRNDLGRVCAYHSVQVAALCRLESYPFVHHLVSEVRGRLRAGLGPVDLLRAAFPGGSVTGAPKVRAMQIIAELEPTARGPYCGALGYIGFDGSMDTNILIRTITLGRGWAQFPVGAGIVADSVPEDEYQETWHKAAGLLRAFEPASL